MKRLSIICCLVLAFSCMAISCNKDKSAKKSQENAEKTIDLAELPEQSPENPDEENAQNPETEENAQNPDANENELNKPKTRSRSVRRNAPSDEEIARRNFAAATDENGNARRGKPAAQLEAEAQRGDSKQREKSRGAAADNFDFSDESEISPKSRARTSISSPREESMKILQLIDVKEIRAQTAYSGVLELVELPGQNPSSRYNALRWVAYNDKELGLSLQVWKPGNESAASKQFSDLYAQSFSGKKLPNLASDAFNTEHHTIRELYFYDASKRAVVALACSQSLCSSDQLIEMARIIQRRL